MTSKPLRSLSGPLLRKDIVAICAYLNRHNGSKAVNARANPRGIHLDKLAAAARMQ